MTTKELAKQILMDAHHDAGTPGELEEAIYLRLLTFLCHYDDDYSPMNEGRQKERTAAEGKYFWLPCVLCGTWFSGREWLDSGGSIILRRNTGHGVCPFCKEEGQRLCTKYPNGIEEEVPE